MVSSYLVCDLCGRFGPPASTFSKDGLRLCCQCWYEAQRDAEPEASGEPAPESDEDAGSAEKTDAGPESR
ncbi:MAG TPA: hypothetical protein P5326_10500 [Candidatus Contendobacter sp.]|jgi:hypothetical protein|nr:hypothetical protein [Candidatus Contendobacter sp.]